MEFAGSSIASTSRAHSLRFVHVYVLGSWKGKASWWPRSATRFTPARRTGIPTPTYARGSAIELDEQSQWEYWAARKDPSLRFRNCGVYGERTDEIAKRFEACASGAEVLVVQGGINDIAQGRDVEPAAENLRALVRSGK